MAATSSARHRSNGETFSVQWSLFDRLAEAKGATTAAQKAALGGVHRATLHRYRSGYLEPSPAFLLTAATRLRVPVEALIGKRSA